MSHLLVKTAHNYQKARSYVRKLQRADDKTKKRFLVWSSIASVLLIVSLWLIYLNLTMPSLGEVNTERKTAISEKVGFFDTLARGFENIRGDFEERFSGLKTDLYENLSRLKEQIERKNEFSYENKEYEYVPETGEPAAPAELP